MLRQALYTRGGLFSKSRGLANSSSFKPHTGLRYAGQPRAFHIFPRLQYDDGSSSYGTTPNSNNSCGTSSKLGTSLGSFKSSFSTLGDDTYSSSYTTPSFDPSIITRRKTCTKAVKPDSTTEYERIHTELLRQISLANVRLEGSLSRLHSELDRINTKFDTLIEKAENPARRPPHPPHQAATDLARPAWWRREKKDRGSFWESYAPIILGSMFGLTIHFVANEHARRHAEIARSSIMEELEAGKVKG